MSECEHNDWELRIYGRAANWDCRKCRATQDLIPPNEITRLQARVAELEGKLSELMTELGAEVNVQKRRAEKAEAALVPFIKQDSISHENRGGYLYCRRCNWLGDHAPDCPILIARQAIGER